MIIGILINNRLSYIIKSLIWPINNSISALGTVFHIIVIRLGWLPIIFPFTYYYDLWHPPFRCKISEHSKSWFYIYPLAIAHFTHKCIMYIFSGKMQHEVSLIASNARADL